MRHVARVLWWVAAVLPGCGFEDGGRCASGYVYHPEVKLCVRADTPGGTGTLQMGEACTASDDQCGPQASYCAVNPITGQGYCTRTGCAEQPCPAGYRCCDCSAFAYPVLCAKTEDATGQLGGLCACS